MGSAGFISSTVGRPSALNHAGSAAQGLGWQNELLWFRNSGTRVSLFSHRAGFPINRILETGALLTDLEAKPSSPAPEPLNP